MPELTHKDAHVCNWDQESFAIDLPSGKTIEGIGTLKANWNYFVPATEQTLSNGLLIRKGDVTLVNPDGQAPIAALNIKMDEKIYFLGERQNVEWSRVRIEAYPRDPQSLDIEGQGAFRSVADAAFPNAPYRKQDEGASYPTVSFFEPHNDFMEEKTGIRNQHGLPVMLIEGRKLQDLSQLESLRNAQSLSADPDIREGIYRFLEGLIKGRMMEELTAPDRPQIGSSTHPRINTESSQRKSR